MRELLTTMISSYKLFFGSGIYVALFIIAILYFIVKEKERRLKKFFLTFVCVFGVFYVLPVTAYIMIKYCGANVYWRMFWILPITTMIAYVLTKVICRQEKRWQRCVVAIGILVMLVQGGVFLYNGNFQPRENRYKISSNVVMVCDAVNEDALVNGIEEKGLIVANELVTQIRQYDASIRMPYGRNALRGGNLRRRAQTIYSIMSSGELDAVTLAYNAQMGNYQYLAYPAGAYRDELLEAGYIYVTAAGSYDVYRLSEHAYGKKDILVTQYGDENGRQSVCYMIRDRKNRLVVIDGGWKEDAEVVRQRIKAFGGKVDAWILTHPHEDYIGAFTEIYKDPQGITINEIYITDMASPELCLENASWDSMTAYEEFLELDLTNAKAVSVGTVIKCGNIDLKVLSAYEDKVDELSNDLLNDGSMMLVLEGNTERMLFCSDIGKNLSEYLLEKYGEELDCDYIQMGHHGNGGLTEEFYRKVSPNIAFFDAPNYLFYDTTGKYTSQENRALMEDIGAEVLSFDTAPNTIVIK